MEKKSTAFTVVRTCEKHIHEELVVYCKTCCKVVCVKCSREDHLKHVCEGLSKIAREIRREIPKTCEKIRQNTLSKMKVDLKFAEISKLLSAAEYEEEIKELDTLEHQIIEKIRIIFLGKSTECKGIIINLNGVLNEKKLDIQESMLLLQENLESLRASQNIKNSFKILELNKEIEDMARRVTGCERLVSERDTYKGIDKDALMVKIEESLTHVFHTVQDANDDSLKNEIEIFSSVQCDVNEGLLEVDDIDVFISYLSEAGLITIGKLNSNSKTLVGTFKGVCKASEFMQNL